MNKKKRTLGVVMPVMNGIDLSKQTYESFKTKYKHHWIIIDNGSTDETEEWVMTLGENVTYIKAEKNLGVAVSWNLGIEKAFELGCDPVFVINNDLIFAPDTVDNLLDWYGDESEARYEFVTVTNVGTDPDALKTYSRKKQAINLPCFFGFLINSRTIKRVGWFDEGFKIAYYEDTDYYHRMVEEGVQAVSVMDAPVVHLGSSTAKTITDLSDQFVENRVRFKEKWGYDPEQDPIKPIVIPKMTKAKLLWVGDAAVNTGFAKVTHEILNWLQTIFDVTVLGVNYHGDPHDYNYPIYPAQYAGMGSPWGDDRILGIMNRVQPNAVLILNDHWNVRKFLRIFEEIENLPAILAYMPVDSLNIHKAEDLGMLDASIFYTEFGQKEAEKCGFFGTSYVVPHGVDCKSFVPMDKMACRKSFGLDVVGENAFLFGNVNRNQPRKRQDLSMEYFKNFLEETGADDAFLYLHCATDDIGYDIETLAHYYGINGKLLVPFSRQTVFHQITKEMMPVMYNCIDVHISTTTGEGWGLTNAEAAACGIPQILPNFAALGEWASEKEIAVMVPAEHYAASVNGMNSIGASPNRYEFVEAMKYLYMDQSAREKLGRNGVELMNDPKFNWKNIAFRFAEIIFEAIENHGTESS